MRKRVYECVAGRIKRNKCAAVGGGSGKCNERGMGRETDLHRERESDGGGGAGTMRNKLSPEKDV